MTLQTALDVSNWQDGQLEQLIAQYHPEHVIVRASTESDQHRQIARQQLQTARDAGCGISIYVWAYWDLSPVEHTADALSTVDSFDPSYVFFDCEDGQPGGKLDDWLSRAVDLAERRGKTCGVYTSPSWWRNNGDSRGFTRLPLWLASYDGNPTLDGLDIPGGWPGASGHQWSSDPIDQSVFAAGFFPTPDPCRTLKAAIAAELAIMDGVRTRLTALIA